MRARSATALIKLDIKDFFLFCKHLKLLEAVSNTSREENVARAVAQFLLDSQYIRIDDLVPSMQAWCGDCLQVQDRA